MNGKPFPPLNSDEEAERFVAEADLTEYDFSGFKRMRFVFREPEARAPVTLNLPVDDLARAGREAEAEGVSLDDVVGRAVHQWLERKAS